MPDVEGGILAVRNCVAICVALKHSSAWVCHGYFRRAGKPGSTAAKDGRRYLAAVYLDLRKVSAQYWE